MENASMKISNSSILYASSPRRQSMSCPDLAQSRNKLAIMLLAGAAVVPGAHSQVLEEVIVTAQKRAENLQQVGIAADIFTADDLRSVGANSLADVTKFATNVQLYDEYGTGQPTWVIRGVGLQDFNANNTPTAAIYVDDVYMSSNVMGGQALFDLERIEVLKGPQGALYGRNTSGGAVRVITQRPLLGESGGYVYGSYGRWDDIATEGAANVPLGDTAAVRLAGRWNRSYEGWQQNLITGEEHGEQDRWALRTSLLATLGSGTEVLLRVHAARDDSETTLAQAVGLYDPVTFDFCAPLLAGRLDDAGCAAYSTFFDPDFRFPDVQGKDGRRTLSDPINRLRNRSGGGSLELSHDFGSVTLTAISGYENFRFEQYFDYDGGLGEFGHQHGKTDIEAFSQEFRLASATNGPLDWQLGLEYAKDELTEDREFLFGDDLFILVPTFGGDRIALGYDQETESWAAWGQLGYQLTDTLKLNAGVRYTDEEKDYSNGGTSILAGSDAFPVSSGLQSDLALDIFSGKLDLDWSFSDSAMLYLSVSRGFKSGGFFGGFPSDGEASIEPYDEETVTAWEIGLKSQWLDDKLRLNAALFHYDYEDVQGYTTIQDPDTGLVLTRLGNIGDAEHDGFEVELQWLPTQRLMLMANGAWLDAEITDSDTVVATWLGSVEPLEGSRRQSTPEYSYSLIGRYTVPVCCALESTLQLDYNWRDDFSGQGLSVIEQTMGDQQEAYGLFGARLSLAPWPASGRSRCGGVTCSTKPT
jgi:iron complex outermembrane recepter protein